VGTLCQQLGHIVHSSFLWHLHLIYDPFHLNQCRVTSASSSPE
jgi:hypothetical protein